MAVEFLSLQSSNDSVTDNNEINPPSKISTTTRTTTIAEETDDITMEHLKELILMGQELFDKLETVVDQAMYT